MNFHYLISDRLNKIRAHLDDEPDAVADRMVHGRFERIKCSYGTAVSAALPTIPIEVPGLAPGLNLPSVNVEDSKMIFTMDDLKMLFDAQIERMFKVIDEQLDRTHNNHPNTQVVEW